MQVQNPTQKGSKWKADSAMHRQPMIADAGPQTPKNKTFKSWS